MTWEKITLLCALIFSFLEFTETGGHFKRVHGAIEVTAVNFKDVIARHRKLVLFFYDDSCLSDHCVHSKHEFLSAMRKHLKECPSEYGR